MNNKIPTYLIHGSLGSGKTTLVKNLLNSQEFKNSVVIENEYANLNIDEQTISQDNEVEIYGISGGCVCCSSGRELLDALATIANAKPKTLIIETTGVANSVRLIQQLLLNEEFDQNFYLARNIFVIDALENTIDSLKSEKAVDIQLADVVIVNKIDKALSAKTKEVKKFVRRLNTTATIFLVERARVSPDKIYTDKSSQSVDNLIKYIDVLQDILSQDHLSATNCVVVSPNKPLSKDSLDNFLDRLKSKGVQIKRVKGVFATTGETLHVEGTAHDIEYSSFTKIPVKSGLVFIGENLNKTDFENFISQYE